MEYNTLEELSGTSTNEYRSSEDTYNRPSVGQLNSDKQ